MGEVPNCDVVSKRQTGRLLGSVLPFPPAFHMPHRALSYGSERARATRHWVPEFVLFSVCLVTLLIGFGG